MAPPEACVAAETRASGGFGRVKVRSPAGLRSAAGYGEFVGFLRSLPNCRAYKVGRPRQGGTHA